MSETQFLQILLGLIGLLVAAMQAWVGWSFKRLSHKVDFLVQNRAECVRQFADKGEVAHSHARIYSRLDDHELRLGRLEGSCKNHAAGVNRD